MAYTVVQGIFRVIGFAPDGDSIRFAPLDVELINDIPGAKKHIEQGASIQLRLEGIDSLETHFTSGSQDLQHQPLELARASARHLLDFFGFTGVERNDTEKVLECDNDDRPGFILTDKFDSHGTRPVAYAFRGALPNGVSDGDELFLKADLLKDSVNYEQLKSGFAYPMYYESAFADLRAELDAAVVSARALPGPTIWTADATQTGFRVLPFDTLTDKKAVWPKLFRRVSSFFHDNPQAQSLAGFVAFLENNPDRCIDLDVGQWTKLHNFVEEVNGTVRMTKDITRLMFKD